jgi:ATP-dependent exoDNAse (exonuclease V) beta subunit
MVSPILKYEASAGSGKTYRLALEYLGRLLLAFAGHEGQAGSPRRRRELLGSVLAITFTVKAAREMKERIVQKLKGFALHARGQKLKQGDQEFLDLLAQETRLAPDRIVGLAKGLIELVLASYDDFNVMTIDSLMSAMVKAVSPDLDLPADYEIAVDDREELQSRSRALLAGKADGQWAIMERTLADYNRYYPYSGWKTDEPLAAKLIEILNRHMQEGTALGEETRAGVERSFRSLRKDFKRELDGLLSLLPEESGHANGRVVNSGLRDDVAAFPWGEDNLFLLEKLLAKSFFLKSLPGELLKKSAPPGLVAEVGSAQERMRSCLQELALNISLLNTLPYCELFPDFLKMWQQGKRTLFVREFSRELAGRFEKWGESGFPYLYLKMSDRFRHFLFDEFQDTSTMQFRALAPLIDEMLSHEPASLFIVGDRKQAIYRWRGGNSELMEEARLREEVPAINHLSRQEFSATLGTNWRSLREIVDFNNRFWNPETVSLITADDDLRQAIRENFKDSAQKLPAGVESDGGYVELTLHIAAEKDSQGESAEAEPREDEGNAMSASHLDDIASIVRRLHDEHGYDYQDIAVLVRKNIQVRDIVRRLGRDDIPTLSDQSLMLGSNPRVCEIIAFFKFLDYPPDDLDFHAFISGEIFHAAARRVSPGEFSRFSQDAWFGRRGPLYKVFKEQMPECWAKLVEPFFQTVGFLPPYDLFSDLCQCYRLYEDFDGDTPFFLALGDALHSAELEKGNSIAGFIRRWDKMVGNQETPSVAIPENTPGVKVLTMHQSKGLEFPAVIVPVDQSREATPEAIFWDGQKPFYINKPLALIQDQLKETFCRESIKGTIDLLNLLYVAFTRAQQALFIPVAIKKTPPPAARDKDGLVKRIMKAGDVVCRHPELDWLAGRTEPLIRGRLARRPAPAETARPPQAVHSKKTSTRSWQSRYLVFKKATMDGRGDRSGAERGERVHDLLSRLGRISDPGELELRVRELAANANWSDSDIQAVSAFLSRADVFAILSRPGVVYREKEVVAHGGALPEFRRLDRLQVGADEVLVIDFKTGREKSKEYNAQLRGYIAAIAPLYPERRCSGFLLYVDRGEIEEVRCSN